MNVLYRYCTQAISFYAPVYQSHFVSSSRAPYLTVRASPYLKNSRMRLLLVGKSTDTHLVGTVDEYVDLKLHFTDGDLKEVTGVFSAKNNEVGYGKSYLILDSFMIGCFYIPSWIIVITNERTSWDEGFTVFLGDLLFPHKCFFQLVTEKE